MSFGTAGHWVEAANNLASEENSPLLHIRVQGDSVDVHGPTEGLIGHRITLADHDDREGVFIEWKWDGESLRVTNDRFGLHPFFYAASDTEICISTSIPAILNRGFSATLDYDALSVLLRLGLLMGDDTPFVAIRALPPHATFVWRPGSFDVRERLAIVHEQPMTKEAAIDGYIQLFRQAILRRLPAKDQFAVPISGGRDSRHIVAELCQQNRPPTRVVTVDYSARERSTAVAIAEKLGLRKEVLRPDKRLVPTEFAKNLRVNFCALEHGWMLGLADFLHNHFDVSFDGIGGDVLSAGLFMTKARLDAFRRQDFEAFISSLLESRERYHQAMLDVTSPEYRERLSPDRARARIQREVRKYVDAANPIAMFFLYNRTRRTVATAPFGLQRDVPTIYCPYLDRDLYQLLSSVSADLMCTHSFHTETIQRAYPQLASIPYGPKSSTVRERLERQFRYRQTAVHMLRLLKLRPTCPLLQSDWLLRDCKKTAWTGSSRIQLNSQIAVFLWQLDGYRQAIQKPAAD